MVEGAIQIAPWCLLATASATDLIWGKVYNLLTLPFLAGGFLFCFIAGGIPQATTSVFGIGTALLLFFPLYLLGAVAAGDVKLLMALGAWVTPRTVFHVAAFSIVVGAVVGAFLLWKQRGILKAIQSTAEHANPTAEKKNSFYMPFAPAFLCGFMLLKIMELRGWSLY